MNAIARKEGGKQPPAASARALVVALIGANYRQDIARHIAHAGPKGSPKRAAAFAEAVAGAVYGAGRKKGQQIGARTLRRWVVDYETRGLLSNRRKGRADKGATRVIAWRMWDRAMDAAGIPKDRQIEIATAISNRVRSLWRSKVSSTANNQTLARKFCRDIAHAEGVGLDLEITDPLFCPPASFAGDRVRKRARLASIKQTDAGRYAADFTPRIRRHREGLAPLDMVAADVRHSDIIVTRPDGSEATPKMVAFLDLATNRVFSRIFLLPKGKAVTRRHVLTALRDLMADPAWGAPRALYIDNGGEFRLGMAADDLANLVALIRDVHGFDIGVFDREDIDAHIGTIRSIAYNPQSKVIENTFSNLTRSIEPMFQGFIGGNRMAKKVENQGRKPTPMEGDLNAIQAQFQGMVDFYNAKPQQRGVIAGRSPNETFTTLVEKSDWGAILLDPGEFALAFGPDVRRTVMKGGELRIGSRFFRHRELAPMVGESVMVRNPLLLDGSRVVVLADKGVPRLVADEVPIYGMSDAAGARDQARRTRELSEDITKAAEGTERLTISEEMTAYVQAVPAMPTPAPMGTATIHPVLRTANAKPTPAKRAPASSNRAQFAALKALARAS